MIIRIILGHEGESLEVNIIECVLTMILLTQTCLGVIMDRPGPYCYCILDTIYCTGTGTRTDFFQLLVNELVDSRFQRINIIPTYAESGYCFFIG